MLRCVVALVILTLFTNIGIANDEKKEVIKDEDYISQEDVRRGYGFEIEGLGKFKVLRMGLKDEPDADCLVHKQSLMELTEKKYSNGRPKGNDEDVITTAKASCWKQVSPGKIVRTTCCKNAGNYCIIFLEPIVITATGIGTDR